MSQFETVALRMPKLETGPFKGTRPIYVSSIQGLAGASRAGEGPEGVLAGMQVNGADPFEGASIGGERPARGRIPLPNRIDEVIIILDRSQSMKHRVSEAAPGSKLDHVKSLVAQLKADGLPEDCPKVLFRFDHRADEPVVVSSTEELIREVAQTTPGGSTQFYNPLARVRDWIRESNREGEPKRRFIGFYTDGKDFSEADSVYSIAEELRYLNAGVYIFGIGDGYNLPHLFHLAGRFGFAGWSHTPESQGGSVLRGVVPEFIRNMSGADSYMKIEVQGSLAGYYAVTPSIVPVRRTMYSGLQLEGAGICFEGPEENLVITLKAGAHASSQELHTEEIKIHDIDTVVGKYEMLEPARDARNSVLTFLAQFANDPNMLRELAREFPELASQAEQAADILETYGEGSLQSRESMTATSHTHSSRGVRVNQWSRVPGGPAGNPDDTRKARERGDQTIVTNPKDMQPPKSFQADNPGGADRSLDMRELHSGNLGPLDRSARSVDIGDIGAGLPNANAYKRAIPYGHARLTFTADAGRPREVVIPLRRTGDSATVGRHPDCSVVLGATGASRYHCVITRYPDRIEIEDLNSRNGLFINNERVFRANLMDGDTIGAGGAEFKINFNL